MSPGVQRTTAAVLLATLGGCSQVTRDRDEGARTLAPSSSGPARVETAAPSATSPFLPPLPAALPDGCYNGLDLSETKPEAAVALLAERCAPGTQPVLNATWTGTTASEAAVVEFDLADASRCLRVIGATNSGELTVRLRAPGGLETPEHLEAPFALLGEEGPICTREAGRHRVLLSTREPASAALQVFSAL